MANKNIVRTLTVAFLFTAYQAFASFDCSLFLTLSSKQQLTEFVEAREDFIRQFNGTTEFDNSDSGLAKLFRQQSTSDFENGIYLSHLPGHLLSHYPGINTDFLAHLSTTINHLEDVGKCFHYRNQKDRRSEPLMALSFYPALSSNSEASPLIFGYSTSVIQEGKPIRIVRSIETSNCTLLSCPFHTTPLRMAGESNKDHNVIRLIHKPSTQPPVQLANQHRAKFKLAKSYLTGVKLYKTGEIFTSPEIYTSIGYYAGENLVSKDAVLLPWITGKGMNTVKPEHLLLQWPANSDKAKIVIMESDTDIPYDILLEAAYGISKIFSFDSYIDSFLNVLPDSIISWFKESGWSEDDYIGTAVVDRTAPLPSVSTKERTAELYFRHE